METVIAIAIFAPVVLYWAWGKGLSDEGYRPRMKKRDFTPIDPLLH